MITIIQPSVPTYRVDFFARLSRALGSELAVYASTGNLGLLTARRPLYGWERELGPVVRLLPGLEWQRGAVSVPVRRGDVVVISGNPRCLSNVVLVIKARLLGAKAVWWGHYWSSTSRRWRFVMRRFLMRFSDALLFYTDKEVAEYQAGSWGRCQPVFALNNGIAVASIQKLRQSYRAGERGCTLLFIGRLTEKAQLALLVRALATPVLNKVRLEVIGVGECEPALRAEVEALHLGDRVIWHGETTDEKWIAEVANRCALFVYPGGVGLSLIHAMGYGLPAIVHDDRYRHMPEIAAFESGITGLSFRCGEIADLAATIADALSDMGRMELWSRGAQERIDHSYNTEAMAERFLALVRSIGSAAE